MEDEISGYDAVIIFEIVVNKAIRLIQLILYVKNLKKKQFNNIKTL